MTNLQVCNSASHLPPYTAEMSKMCSHGFPKVISFPYFKHLFQYPSSVNLIKRSHHHQKNTTHFMVDYLIESLGLSTDEASTASKKLTHLKSTKKPNSVIDFFKQTGLKDTQIRNMVSSRPRLLSSDVEKTLKPKVRVFEELGLSGSDLTNLIASDPFLFTRGLKTRIIPSIEFLETLLGSKENVIKILKKSNRLFSSDTIKRMQPNILLLQKYGVPDSRIKKLVLENPRCFLLDPNRLENIIEKIEGEFGISRDSWMFSHAIDAISSVSSLTIESKFKVFESFGWLKSDFITMTRNLPYCMSLSETKIVRGLNFLMKEVGYDPGYIASHPKLLMYSLEKRVEPRNVVLRLVKEKKLIKKNPSLYSIVGMPETQFLNDILLPHKDEIPDVYETYIRKTNRSSTKAT